MQRLAAEDESVRREKGTLHTPGEILKQPAVWRRTARAIAGLRPAAAKLRTEHDDFIILSGAGSSLNAAALTAEMLRGECGPRVAAISGTDILLGPGDHVPSGGRGTLISLSRSGNSPEVVEAARRVGASHPSVAQMAVTCKSDGALAQWMREDPARVLCVLDEETYDHGLATTVSVTSSVLAALFLAHPISPVLFEANVDAAAAACESLLDRHAAAAQDIARRKPERVVFLGTGPLQRAAQEGALKVLELTDGRVATMSHNCLEFRHGPISFLQERTVLICFGSASEGIRPYERDFVRQIREARAADRVVVLAVGADAGSIALPALDGLEALPAIVFAQMLGLFLSLEHGLKPDRPGDRGLVNPVVQGVTLYPLSKK